MPMSPHWVANCCSLLLSLSIDRLFLSLALALFSPLYLILITDTLWMATRMLSALHVFFYFVHITHTHTLSVHSLVQQHTMPLYFISLVLCTLDINNDNINNMHVFLHKIRSHKHQHILIKGFPYNFPQTCHMYAFALGVCVFNYYNVSLAFLCRPFVILLCISHKNLIH